MDKRKSKPQTLAVVDELALAKSAAWAWYQHGSGSDGRSIREIDVWRTKIEPKPSRYKLEALRNVQLPSSSTIMLSSPRSSMSLLDNYEIESISRQLDYYIESSHAKYHAGGDSGGGPGAEAVAVAEIIKNNKVVRKKKIAKGFRLRHVPACGSSIDDVVDMRRPEKGGVAVVEVTLCRPRRF